MSFLAELKRRNVFRVATVYAATAFVVLQVAALTFAPLHLPSWAMTLVVVLVILGFPITLVMAWAFELTPGGIQRTEPAEAVGGGSRTWIGKRTVALSAGLVVLGVGLGAGWFLRPAASGLIGGSDDPVTLAVLPFHNLSGDEATEPFVHGVHDDLLTHLSGIADLEVISRTSVMGYQGTDKTIPRIARELGASAILEGGIQRSGDRIRMNVQLIDARTDRHLWAERYDRTLTAENVFAIQAEIAAEIAVALRAALTPEERADLARAPTADLEALDLYYRGSDLYERRIFASATAREAVSTLEAAVAADPGFAAAWAMLARARAWLVREGSETDPYPPREALARARALAPSARETELAAVEVLYYNEGDFPGAAERSAAALARWRDDPEFRAVLSAVLRRLGRWRESIVEGESALRTDPRNVRTLTEVATSHRWLRDLERAEDLAQRALAAVPDFRQAHYLTFQLLLENHGDIPGARRYLTANADRFDPGSYASHAALVAYYERDFEGGLDAIRGQPIDPEALSPLYMRALLFRATGRDAEARRWADSLRLRADRDIARVRAGADPFVYEAQALGWRAIAHALLGDVENAERDAERAAELLPLTKDAVDGMWVLEYVHTAYVLTGNRDRAFAAMERYYLGTASKEGSGRLRLDPTYDSLRSDSRFDELARRLEELERRASSGS